MELRGGDFTLRIARLASEDAHEQRVDLLVDAHAGSELLLEDGIAQRPIDIDATFLFGYGFPRHLGGPMHYADQVGLQKIVGDLEAFAKDDPQFWKTPALLADLAAHHKSFAELNDT